MIRSTVAPEMATATQAISEELDVAMAQLAEADRSALTLRYLKGMTTDETAQSLAISPEAAAKRISRAVGRLRRIMEHRGIIASSIAPSITLPDVLAHLPRIAAPPHLIGAVTAAAHGTAATTAGITIAKSVGHMMTITKLKAASILIAIMLTTIGAGVGAVKIMADDNATAPPAPVPAPAPGQVVVNPTNALGLLANGVSVEILGVCENPSQGKQWWDAGGAPLQSEPYARMQVQLPARAGYVSREIALKIDHKVNDSNDPATVSWRIDKAGALLAGPPVDDQGQLISGLDPLAVQILDQPAGATLHVKVAAGKWQTLVTDSGGGSMATGTGDQEFVFSQPFTANNETHIVVAGLGIHDADVRLVVIDRSGKQHVARCYNMANSKSGFVAEFGGNLRTNSMRECRLQTRPFNQWIEFRNISLHSGQITNVQTVTSDDQPK